MTTILFLITGAWLSALTIYLLRFVQRQGATDAAQEARMSAQSELIAAVDAETTRIANRLDELIAAQQAGGMTAEEEAANNASISAILDRMRVMGTDPAAPISDEPLP